MFNYDQAVIITNTGVVTGTFRAIHVLTAAVFTTLTSKGHTTNGNVTQSVGADYGTVPVGAMLYGTFTNITLASGRIIAYK